MSILQIKPPRWAAPLLMPAKYKGAHGGRGSGKSHFFAEMLIEAHIIDHDSRSVCVREIQKSLSQSVKRLLETKIESLNAGDYFEVHDAVIKSRRGAGSIIFQGMQNHMADCVKSLEGYGRIWIDDAQSLSQRSLDLLRPTIRKPKSEIWATWNPRSPDDPIDQLLRGPMPPSDAIVVQTNYYDNPWVPDALIDQIKHDKQTNPAKYRHIWLGKYQKNARTYNGHKSKIERVVSK